MIDQLEHFAPSHVDRRQQTLDRAGVAVVGRALAVEEDAAHDAAGVLDGQAEVARRPWVDLHLVEIGDAAVGHRLAKAVVLVQSDDGVERLLEAERGTHALDVSTHATTSPVGRATLASTSEQSGPGTITNRTRRPSPGVWSFASARRW